MASFDDLWEIGFSDNVVCGDRTFHIQTEVIVSAAIKIKTTVLDRGVVLDSVVSFVDRNETNIIDRCAREATQQHGAVVLKTKVGQYITL